ncbi:MAG TPA: GTPase HflX, partial [Propionibacteriaceae bacterium]|nr:GTPase HflX [Propionibacteriaceae bacterium]
VRHLPHDLVEAFASTLEESTQADLLVHVVDGSDPDPVGQIDAVRAVLADIDAAEIRELIVINKVDRATADSLAMLGANYPDAVFVSARTGKGIDQLRATIESLLPRPEIEIRALIPYERGDLVNSIHQTGEFLSTEHLAAGTLVVARVNPALAGELAPYELVSSNSARRGAR